MPRLACLGTFKNFRDGSDEAVFDEIMATSKFILDQRSVKPGKPAPLKVSIAHQHKTRLISLNIYLKPQEWDVAAERVVNHASKAQYNAFIAGVRAKVENTLIRLMESGEIASMDATALQKHLQDLIFAKKSTQPVLDPSLVKTAFEQFVSHKSGRTKDLYMVTYRKMLAFCGEKGFEKLGFSEIKPEWLQRFDDFLATTSPSVNARNIHMRNLRAIFNDAISNEITTNYPFRRFKLKPEPTRKRNFPVETLRNIFNAKGLEDWQYKYLDLFKLTFMLIGINFIDLVNLKEMAEGRIDYLRAKTHKPYSIKVEPEAAQIISKYAGEKYLLNYLDTNKNYRVFYFNTCKGLAEIRDALGLKELTTYWARHSWATIAASLDIPRETIAAALGHGGNTVTDIYIEFDHKKVDEANRRVLDWVLYGKDWRKPEHTEGARHRGRPRKSQNPL